MAIKVGINGFGRIGRMVLRAAVQDFPDIEIVGINDLLEPDYLAYMLRHDSVHGRFKGDVSVNGNTLVVNGKKIRLTAVKDPAELKWNEVGAEVVTTHLQHPRPHQMTIRANGMMASTRSGKTGDGRYSTTVYMPQVVPATSRNTITVQPLQP